MTIPVPVQAGAWTGWRVGKTPEGAETERALAIIAEQALQRGARAGLDALLKEALRVSGAAEVAIYSGRERVAVAGLDVPALPSKLRATKGARLFRAPDGRTSLVVHRERPGAAAETDAALARMASFCGTLVAARERECEAQARQAALLSKCNRLQQAVAHQERRRKRAAHDLRTPLLVIQGYVGMMMKGAAGPLTPTMQRYLQQLLKASTDQSVLIERRLSDEGAPEDLRGLLCAAFERPAGARRASVNLEFSTPTVPVRGPAPVLDVLVRTLARSLAATGAPAADLTVDTVEGTGMWRLRLCAQTEHPLPVRTVALLEQLMLRLGGNLSIQLRPRLALTLHLPSAR
jgi:signal transduction histidine kinase